MSDRPTVVLAHYDNEVLSTYRSQLEVEGFRVQATSSGPDVLKRVEAGVPDAVILEALLPRMNGLAVLKGIKDLVRKGSTAVIMVLDDGDTYTENRALICGADAIVKRSSDGQLPDGALGAKLRSVLNEQALGASAAGGDEMTDNLHRLLETASQNLRDENPILTHITDSLTGLFNAGYMEIKLSEEFKRSRRFGNPLTVVDIQLQCGNEAGEAHDGDPEWRRMLNEVAGLLLCESRDIDVLSRCDAKTFRLLLPHTAVKGAMAMTERILDSISERKMSPAGTEVIVTASAGIAEYTGDDVDSAEELKRRSSEALSQAWGSGGSCQVVWAAPSE